MGSGFLLVNTIVIDAKMEEEESEATASINLSEDEKMEDTESEVKESDGEEQPSENPSEEPTVSVAVKKEKKPEFQTVHCDVCKIFLNSQSQASAHFNGKSHQNKSKAQSLLNINTPKVSGSPSNAASPLPQQSLKCELCQRTFNSGTQLQAHVTGKSHTYHARNKIAASNTVAAPQQTASKPPMYGPVMPKKLDGAKQTTNAASLGANVTKVFHCAKCDITLNSQRQMEQHNKGLRHKIVIGKAKPPQNVATGEKWENVRYMKIANAVLGINKDTITGSGGGMNLREFYCEKCDLTVNSQTQLDQHLESQKHKMRDTEMNGVQNKRKRDSTGYGDSFNTGTPKYQPYKKPTLQYQPRFEAPNHSFVPPLAMNFVHGSKHLATDGYYTSDQVNFMKQYGTETFPQSWNHNFIY